MAYHHNHKHHNRNHYGSSWNVEPYNENVEQPVHHHYKGFSTIYEHPIEEAYPTRRVREPKKNDEDNFIERYQRPRFEDSNSFESVDQEADAFIQYEHKRMELAKLISMGAFN
ncbi:hypothetical protein HN51_013978 [Arachis hypogaea]|nr:uncharacterized protein DS421_3g102330 [Arachis hypogaea]